MAAHLLLEPSEMGNVSAHANASYTVGKDIINAQSILKVLASICSSACSRLLPMRLQLILSSICVKCVISTQQDTIGCLPGFATLIWKAGVSCGVGKEGLRTTPSGLQDASFPTSEGHSDVLVISWFDYCNALYTGLP